MPFLPDEDEPGERWLLLHAHDAPYDLQVEVGEGAFVEAELLGPDGEVIVELLDRAYGPFGFTREPWSIWRRS